MQAPSQGLIETLLEAPHRLDGWPDALERICSYMGASAAVAVVREQSSENEDGSCRLIGSLLSDDAGHGYMTRYGRLDPVAPLLMRANVGATLIEHREVPAEDLRKSAFHNEWARPHQIHQRMSTKVCVADAFSGNITLFRDSKRLEFGDDDVARFNLLRPYLRNALGVETQLVSSDSRSDLVAGVLEVFAEATFMLDRQMRVIALNGAARDLLAQGNDIRFQKDRVAASSPEKDALLRAWLHAPPGSTRSTWILLGADDKPALRFMKSFLPRGYRNQGASLLFVRPLVRRVILPPEDLMQLLNLSRIEANITSALAHGRALEDIAEMLEITVGTVRNHLKRIFAKLHIKRQTELVSLVSSLLPSVAPM